MKDKKKYQFPLLLTQELSPRDVLDASSPITDGNDFDIGDNIFNEWN